jgi:hypothetical protein
MEHTAMESAFNRLVLMTPTKFILVRSLHEQFTVYWVWRFPWFDFALRLQWIRARGFEKR